MKLKEMTIEQMLKECKKHKCELCPFCKDIWEEQDDGTGAKDIGVDCAISSIRESVSDNELEKEYDL